MIIYSDKRHIKMRPETMCVECGKKAEIYHHIIPYSKGGRTAVPLCPRCHNLVHEIEGSWSSQLIKDGLARAKVKGVKLGRPSAVDISFLKGLIKQGVTYRQIAKLTGASNWLISRTVKELRPSD